MPRFLGFSCLPCPSVWTHPVAGTGIHQCLKEPTDSELMVFLFLAALTAVVIQLGMYSLDYCHLADPKVDHCVHQVAKRTIDL